jgi:hypothetical protein
MRRHLQDIAFTRCLAVFDCLDFFADGDQCINKAVKFFFALRFRGLDHEGVGHWPTHGWGVEAVILETLGDVDGFNAGSFFEASDVEDEFMGAA